MAQQILTGNEGETDFQFDEWVTDNNLNDVRDLLLKHKMTDPDTLNTNSAEFVKLMTDPALFSKGNMTTTKLLTALQKVPVSSGKVKEVIKIYISKEEEEATDKLDKYAQDILNLKQQITQSNKALSKNVEECNKSVQTAFNYVFNKLNAKKQEIEGKLKDIEQKRRSQIHAKSQLIDTQEQKVQNTKNKCIELQEDGTMDRSKRKYAIVSLVDGIMNNKLSHNIGAINTEIIFDSKIDNISFDDLLQIYDGEQHPIPIIDDIECKSITQTTANIHFNAKLSNKDKDRKISSDLYMKLESFKDDLDEKEQKISEIEAIKFDKNKEKYEFELNKLTKNTNYEMYINLYQAHGKMMRKLMDIDAISVTFKTLQYELIDKVFVYASHFDTNGICYAIGSNYGEKQWSNPVSRGLITMNSSGWSYGKIEQIVGREQTQFQCHSQDKQNSWFSIDFGAKLKIKPTHYTLRHAQNTTNYLRTWNFEGSNDGTNWSVVKQHQNDTSLNAGFASHTWMVECNDYYQMFRIYMTDKDSTGRCHLLCSGLEIYGHLTGSK